MITLRPGQQATDVLRSGRSVTVTVLASGYAYFERYMNGARIDITKVAASSSQTFGPNNLDVTYKVSAAGSAVTVQQQDALQTLGTADA